MARYRTVITGSTATAADTAIGAYLMGVAAGGFSLKRITAGLVTVSSTSAPPDQNCVLGIAPATGAPSGTITAATVTAMKPWYRTASALAATTWATTVPTFGAATADAHQIPISSRGGYEGVWEPPQEWDFTNATTSGIVLVNRQNALITPLAWKVAIEWEE
jgi:hypothetical protein